jgi:hypothetical protein
LITNVATILATVHDSVTVPAIHDALAARDCLPGEHWVDARYPTVGQVVGEVGVDAGEVDRGAGQLVLEAHTTSPHPHQPLRSTSPRRPTVDGAKKA